MRLRNMHGKFMQPTAEKETTGEPERELIKERDREAEM